MLTEKELKRFSKFLSYVLRHKPEQIGIELDSQGWTNVDTLITKANLHDVGLDKDILKTMVETNSKKRFAFDETFKNIRASQGHSIKIDLGYENQKPPDILYHGTSEKSVPEILKTGLDKRDRQSVHLSANAETAKEVGSRHGKPFIFKILAGKMHEDNFEFFLSANGVWLTDNVPVKYLLPIER